MNLKKASQNTPSIEISIIVPTYNERDNVKPLVERVHKALSDYRYEIIIVDDNSPDGTADAAESLSTEYPLRVIVRKTERGLATAVIAGFNEARGDVLGVIDADLQHPPEHIPELLKATKDGADVAIASRYVPGGGIEGWTLKRAIISKGAKLPVTMLFTALKGIQDPLSGFFVFRKTVIDGVTLSPIGYKILLEVLLRGKADVITEVPYTFRERERGQSNLNFAEQINYIKHLMRLLWITGELRRFVKYALVGISGFGVNLGLLSVFHEIIGIDKGLSGTISYGISIQTNFMLNELWTFRDKRHVAHSPIMKRVIKFNLISSIGWAINNGVYRLLYAVVGLWYILSMIIAIAVVTLWNFYINMHWTWKQKERNTTIPL